MKVFLVFLLTFTSTIALSQGTLVVTVHGIDTKLGGDISIGVFKKDGFLKTGKQALSAYKPINDKVMTVTFNNVPAGEYGLAVFQDIDKNKNLKTNFVGFPKEPFGFSNDAKIKLGPPSFEDAKVQVENGKTLALSITLK